ncbi:LacI family transcriptional regulator [Tissierella sp. MSJ-40]|uniref:LacI family transcriptional regulator n=1 Tax=Tissierella simiarum TaxID=2841534 RepID=A0ABS6E1B4_9FIRM|nr:LacI family DNA-binding transcriptional regulator [Tissierella simiarum]MBU5436693.1 LacI family transcriptional regulator [Tissierella simiarum]
MAITIHDVAEKAGVSIATVSRVINNNYPVKDETREKIEKAIEELGYVPNEIARSLILKSTSNVGIIVPGITNLFFPTIVEEINKTLRDEGFIISLFTTDGDPKAEKKLVDNVISRNMDGIIVIDPSVDNLENGYFEGVSKKIPTIIINGNTNKYNCNFVSYDEEVGTKEAFNYLLELGHKEIVFIRGDKSLSYDLKENIYRKFIKDNNLKYEKVISVGMGNSLDVVEKTQEIFEKFLSLNREATGVFACNDLMAVGVINACNKSGIKIPEDMSVIGFDNTLLSNISHPKITTVDLNMKEIGQTAAFEIMNMTKKNIVSTKKIVYDTKLIHKESCGKRVGPINNGD